MRFLIFLTFLCSYAFSTDIGFIEDHPKALNCFHNAPRQKDRFPLFRKILENGKRFIIDCIENVAKSDSEKQKIKKEITSVLLQTYEFAQVDQETVTAR
ncbi:unnamed protein product [Caenorhabditis angaria]|uniref:Uncharacterized protein n=1 Tax=Caenorhabditis angaria TaxID=860376 RepID=A0A9P1II28_9PELO|nr:unnamed protein product [Caenorhabditis angaria]